MSISTLGTLFQFIGGLGMFLYGMESMADGLQKFAGNRLQRVLEILTSNRLLGVLVGVGNAVFGTLLAWLVLANRTRDLTRRHDVKSMPQLFEKRFQSPGMRLFACVVIFVFLIPYSASVYKGLTSVCSVILGIDATVCMLIIHIASAVVLVLGDYMATLKADVGQ